MDSVLEGRVLRKKVLNEKESPVWLSQRKKKPTISGGFLVVLVGWIQSVSAVNKAGAAGFDAACA